MGARFGAEAWGGSQVTVGTRPGTSAAALSVAGRMLGQSWSSALPAGLGDAPCHPQLQGKVLKVGQGDEGSAELLGKFWVSFLPSLMSVKISFFSPPCTTLCNNLGKLC